MTITDVTNSPKDWEDFWYNSSDITMTKVTRSKETFDELLHKYRSMSIPQQLDNIRELGRQLDKQLQTVIGQLDKIIETDFDPDKVQCTVDDKEVDCNTWEHQE